VAGWEVFYFFLTRHPCRIVTTSAKEDHLRVLWGEIGGFISSCDFVLDFRKGGPLVVNHQELRKWTKKDGLCPKSYCKGLVASLDSIAAMGGHHIASTDGVPRTLFVIDEASSVRDEYLDIATPWADRVLVLGNTWPCDNFWRRAVEEGDRRVDGRPFRRIFHLTAEDSPNVRLARAQVESGVEPTGEVLIPGVKTWERLREEQETRGEDHEWISVAHKAEFYKGPQSKLFPQHWLDRAETLPQNDLSARQRRRARAIGIDPGEGSADTALCAVDELGIIALESIKTPDTSVIPGLTIAFGKRWGAESENWIFDRGGGGKQHADALRKAGHQVRTVAFGEGIVADVRRGTAKVPYLTRLEIREDRNVYLNRRAEMYGEASMLLDPSLNPKGYGIPRAESKRDPFRELRRQLLAMPKCWDGEGRLWLPPKNKKDPDSRTKTLVEILGCSPDEADAFVLAIHGMLHRPIKVRAGLGGERKISGELVEFLQTQI